MTAISERLWWGGRLSVPQAFLLTVLLSTSTPVGVQAASFIEPDTAHSFVESSAPDQSLDQQRADLQILGRIRELGTYNYGWDGIDGKPPVRDAMDQAEAFARLLPLDEIHAPHISLAGDGEITFLWILAHLRLDLGFFGDGTYAYYGKTPEGIEYMADHEPFNKPLSQEILSLLRKRHEV